MEPLRNEYGAAKLVRRRRVVVLVRIVCHEFLLLWDMMYYTVFVLVYAYKCFRKRSSLNLCFQPLALIKFEARVDQGRLV